MPQVDKATFLTITAGACSIYLVGYLFLNATALFSLFVNMKVVTKRSATVISSARSHSELISRLTTLPTLHI